MTSANACHGDDYGMYRATFTTTISLTVEVLADDAEAASDAAWEHAEAYLNTLMGDGVHVLFADASLDGIGADEVARVP